MSAVRKSLISVTLNRIILDFNCSKRLLSCVVLTLVDDSALS